MKIQLTKLGRKISKVSLQFESKDIRNGTVKSVYDKIGKVIGQYPKVDAVEKTLYYDFNNSDHLEEVKRYFERMIQTYGEKEKPFQGSNQGTAK